MVYFEPVTFWHPIGIIAYPLLRSVTPKCILSFVCSMCFHRVLLDICHNSDVKRHIGIFLELFWCNINGWGHFIASWGAHLLFTSNGSRLLNILVEVRVLGTTSLLPSWPYLVPIPNLDAGERVRVKYSVALWGYQLIQR